MFRNFLCLFGLHKYKIVMYYDIKKTIYECECCDYKYEVK